MSLRAKLTPGAFATAVILGVCQPASAQESRAALIAEEQVRKSAELDLEGPGPAERVVIRVMRSPLLAGRGGVYPWFGSAYQGTGMAVGAGYLKRIPYRGRLNVLAGISVRGSSIFDVSARLPELGRGLFSVSVNARRTNARELSFYGLGPDSTSKARLRYDYQPTEASATATLRPLRWVEFSGGYRFLDLTTKRRSPMRPIMAPGLGRDLTYHISRASAAIDWRASPGYTTRGGLYRVTWSQYRQSGDGRFSFDILEYEAVQHVPLLQEQFGLAMRALVTITTTEDGRSVPFVLTPYLGSGETLRGFVTWRFTDRNRLLLSGEYRWRPSRFLDMALFVDAGTVAPRSSDLSLSNLETNVGIGARFHGPSFTAFRAELAKGREGWRLILAGRQTF